jgi:hypothetical protein
VGQNRNFFHFIFSAKNIYKIITLNSDGEEVRVKEEYMDNYDMDAEDGEGSPVPRPKKSKSGGTKVKKPRAATARSSDSSMRWVTCVACGKICKSNYLFKVHLRNFGPFHNNSCAICQAEFETWEQHIAHLVN